MKNPIRTGNIIEMNPDDLIMGKRNLDRNLKTLEQIDNNVPLKELEYYKSPKPRGDSAEESTKMFVNLYKSIKKHGWKDKPYIQLEIQDYGQMRVRRGRHRTSILKYLGIKKIKVELLVFDKCKNMLDKIFRVNKKREGKLYQRIDMPYLKNVPVYGGQDRIKYILKSIDFNKLNVLDIGCRMGMYSHYPAKHGANVTGVDSVAQWKEIDDYLTVLYSDTFKWNKKLNVKFYTSDIYDWIKKGIKYDVVLFLSVFHHLSVGNRKNAYKLLMDISKSSKVMVFDAGNQWNRLYGVKDVPADLIKHSEFTQYRIIGKRRDGDMRRYLYLFWKGKKPKWVKVK